MFNISDYNYFTIEINDGGWRTWYIPKFRIYMVVDEPNIYLYWSDNERPGNGIKRMLEMNYTDVLFGAYAPSSATEVQSLISGLQDKAWDDIIGMLGNYVPYTGANQNVDLGTFGLTADYVAFDLNPVAGAGAGQIVYDGQTGSLTYLLNNSSVPSHIGQTLHAYCHNAEGAPISKGEAVYLYQATGNKASVKLARNLSDSTSAKTLGLAAEDIGTGQNGMVITVGQLQGVDTSMFSEGDTLYLANTFGDLTNVKPYAPEHLVYIGVVEKANANGEIYIRVQNGYELDEIHDVDLVTTPPVAGDVLTFDGTLWVNQAPAGGSGTVTSIATTSPITGGTITTSGTIGINNAAADGSTKGAAAFTASDFNDNGSGVISIDYTNGQVANGSTKGFLTSADWTTFNNKQAALVSGTNIKTINGTSILGSGDLDTGYCINVMALTSAPVDGATIYFGMLPKAPVTTANISKVYIPRAGVIKRAEIYTYSGTAGTAENWSGYIRLNNTTDTLIQTRALATNERVFTNSSLSIAVVAGDYIEIKFINPTWATNPNTTIFGGYIYIE